MRIEQIVSDIPEGRAATADVIADAGADPLEARYFEKMFQMRSVSVADPHLSVEDHLDRLLAKMGPVDTQTQPDTLIYVHAQPVARAKSLPDRASLRHKPWLAQLTQLFELDQYNCAGAFYALQLARDLLASGQSQRVLIFAGDSLADWPLRYRYIPAVTLLGDAFFAMTLSARSGGLQVRALHTHHDRRFPGGIDADTEEMRVFNLSHAELVATAMDHIGHIEQPARDLLPHNINGLAWKMFAHDHATLTPARTDLVSDIGHCCTTDPFVLLDRMMNEDAPINASLLSVGMGAYVGAAHVQHI